MSGGGDDEWARRRPDQVGRPVVLRSLRVIRCSRSDCS
jgi:hypothetical protein